MWKTGGKWGWGIARNSDAVSALSWGSGWPWPDQRFNPHIPPPLLRSQFLPSGQQGIWNVSSLRSSSTSPGAMPSVRRSSAQKEEKKKIQPEFATVFLLWGFTLSSWKSLIISNSYIFYGNCLLFSILSMPKAKRIFCEHAPCNFSVLRLPQHPIQEAQICNNYIFFKIRLWRTRQGYLP